jgi:signal transduction histidine kinase
MRSIRATLTTWYTVALAATVVAFGVALSTVQRRANFAALDQRLTGVADLVANLLAAEHRAGGRLLEVSSDPLYAALRLDVQDRLDPITGWVVVVDTVARRVYGSAEVRRLTPVAGDSLRGRVFSAPTDRAVFALVLDGARVRFVARRLRGEAGPEIAGVAVGEPVSDLEVGPRRLVVSMLAVAPLILVLAAGMGYLLSARALQPVTRMIDELEAISDGRSLHRRLPVLASADELGRLSAALNSLLARLETSFTALRRFVADASHELKTPLTVMRAGVERALTSQKAAPELLVPLEETLQELRRMTELVDALLTLARVDEGRMELHREPVDLGEVMQEVHETTQMLGEEAGVEVTLDVPSDSVMVEGDPGRLRQLVMNLATNAVKYTPAGGHVWLSLTGTAQAATIAVRDTGIGIAPGDVGRVFDRFWRADPARSRTGERPGIGLGLSISRWIAEAHGGSIGLTSRPGRGSTFTVTLPRAGSPAPTVIES